MKNKMKLGMKLGLIGMALFSAQMSFASNICEQLLTDLNKGDMWSSPFKWITNSQKTVVECADNDGANQVCLAVGSYKIGDSTNSEVMVAWANQATPYRGDYLKFTNLSISDSGISAKDSDYGNNRNGYYGAHKTIVRYSASSNELTLVSSRADEYYGIPAFPKYKTISDLSFENCKRIR